MAKLVDIKMALVAGQWVAVKMFAPEITRERRITRARFSRGNPVGANFIARERELKK